MTADAPILIENGRLLDIDEAPHSPVAADILIEGDRIAAIAPASDAGDTRARIESRRPGCRVIDARDRLIAPGFVNAHYHSHDVFLKGCFEPSVLEYWALNALPRAYPPRSLREIRARTLLGAVECIRNGITTVQDMLTLFPMTGDGIDTVARAYAEAGLRVVLGLQVADVSPLDTVPYWRETIPQDLQTTMLGAPPPSDMLDPVAVMEATFRDHADVDPLVRWAVCPSSPERCSPALLDAVADIARRYDLPVCSHIYISKAEAVNARGKFQAAGHSLIGVLQAHGLLGPRTTLAHGVWLAPQEIAAVAEAGASLALNPLSNLKTKNGVAPIRALLAVGVNLGIGCDNCSCSDAQNMFQAMKLFALLAAISDPEEGPPHAVDALRAATTGGARAVGLAGEVGAIRAGMKADLVILDLADPVFVPLNSAARQMVYGEGGRGVETVLIDGRIVMDQRRITLLDEGALRAEVEALMPGFLGDAEAVFARTAALRPYIAEADRRIWSHDIGLDRYVGGRER